MLLSLIAAIGIFALPALAYVFRGQSAISRSVDSFALVAVVGTILVGLVPELMSQGDWLGIGLFAAGIAIPYVAERRLKDFGGLGLAMGACLFLVHSALDGAVLSTTDDHGIVTAILIHRLPAGLLLYLVSSEAYSSRIAFGLLTLFGFATLGGAHFGPTFVEAIPFDNPELAVEAFLGGALLHVLFHMTPLGNKDAGGAATPAGCCAVEEDPAPSSEETKAQDSAGCHASDEPPVVAATSCHSEANVAVPESVQQVPEHSHEGHDHSHEGHDHSHGGGGCHEDPPASPGESVKRVFLGGADLVGVALGVGTLLFLNMLQSEGSDGHGALHGNEGGTEAFGTEVVHAFGDLAVESAVALCLAYFLGGLLHAFFPKSALGWLARGGAGLQSLKGVLFGLPLPICSCGVLPLYQTLVKRGIPPAAGMAFLVATPELGLDAILLSLPLLGGEFTLVRVLCAFALALVAGVFVGRLLPSHTCPELSTPGEAPKEPIWSGLKRALVYGSTDLVDNTMPWVLVGLGIAAVCTPGLSESVFAGISDWAQVPAFALIGIPVYVCASGATPLAAVALLKGVSPGATLAFLLTGPATNATTFGVLKSLHGKKSALWFGGTIAVGAIALGYIVDIFVRDVGAVSAEMSHETSMVSYAATVGLLLLLLFGVLRLGLRGFFAKVVNPH